MPPHSCLFRLSCPRTATWKKGCDPGANPANTTAGAPTLNQPLPTQVDVVIGVENGATEGEVPASNSAVAAAPGPARFPAASLIGAPEARANILKRNCPLRKHRQIQQIERTHCRKEL